MSEREQIALLRKHLYQKLTREWKTKWKTKGEGRYGKRFVSFEDLPNKKGFFEAVKEDLDELLKSKFGLDNASERTISPDSIQRFFNPSHESRFDEKTRNAMAFYAGYSDWPDFVRATHRRNQKKWIGAGIALFVGIAGVWGILNFYNNQPKPTPLIDLSKVTLKILSATNNRFAPTNIKFEYDFQNAGEYDSAFINYDGVKVRLNGPKGIIEHLYIYPTIRPIFIRINKKGEKFVKTFPYIVKTGEWLATLKNAQDSLFNCKQYRQNGVLHVLPNAILEENKQIDYYTYFDKIDDFGIEIDHCEVAIRVKNPKAEGGLSCFDINLNIHGTANGEINTFSANILHPSCSQFSAIRLNNFVWGYDHILHKPLGTLHGMTAEVENWRILRVRFKDHRVSLFLEDKLLKTFRYKKPMGEMKQLTIGFKGAGSVDFAKISNSYTGKTVFLDDFN